MAASHVFSLFCSQITRELTDQDLVARITHVLRMQPGDTFVLFDRTDFATVRIENISKKSVTVEIISQEPIKPLTPEITVLLPLLKREAFEDALYSMAELGVTAVQPVITEKSGKSWGSEKDLARAERIFIAAAEQSKQFSIPVINKTCGLLRSAHGECFAKQNVSNHIERIIFTPSGKILRDLLPTLNFTTQITCLIGPEGDLTPQEYDQVIKSGFTPCALTPTVLRAPQALTVGIGVLRSWLR